MIISGSKFIFISSSTQSITPSFHNLSLLYPSPLISTMSDFSIHCSQIPQCQFSLSITPRSHSVRYLYPSSLAPTTSVSFTYHPPLLQCQSQCKYGQACPLIQNFLWEEAPYREGENIYQLFICQEINIQNM